MMQKEFFNSAPVASICGEWEDKYTGKGAYPRDLLIGNDTPEKVRITESSQRVRIGRSCNKKASANPDRRALASLLLIAIGSSIKLPLVITSGGICTLRFRGTICLSSTGFVNKR